MKCLSYMIKEMKNIDFNALFYPVLSLIISTVVFTSCSKNEGSNLIMSVSPPSTIIVTRPDTTIRFVISINSGANVTKLIITQDITGSPKVTLLDSSLNTQTVSYQYDFYIPQNLQGKNMVLVFYCSDESGKTFTVLKQIYVLIVEEPLKETAGHSMYSRLSGKECGYDLISGEGNSLDDTLHPKDIQDNTTDTISHNLSKSWISPYGNQFVIFNEFDYANATTLTAMNAYNSGVKVTELKNLAPGNIIITKIDRNTYKDYYVVIKITNIFDNPNDQDDLYLFNLKKE